MPLRGQRARVPEQEGGREDIRKLNFLSSHTYCTVGREATQTLLHCMGKKPYTMKEGETLSEVTTAFDEPLRLMHDFFKILFKHLPPLIVPLAG